MNVSQKLAEGNQVKKVYNPNAKENQYYINNLIGELGELVFAKAVEQYGYRLGVEDLFKPFRNSDVCDFYSSKTYKTIDVKTISNKKHSSLIVSESIANWREVDNYVLVKLHTDKELKSEEDVLSLRSAKIVGYIDFESMRDKIGTREFYGKQVYFVGKSMLKSLSHLLKEHFYKSDEKAERYYPNGKWTIEIAETGGRALQQSEYTEQINALCNKYKYNRDGKQNFEPKYLKPTGTLVFALDNGKFHTSLFLKGLLSSAYASRISKRALVIPAYIEQYVPIEDKFMLIDIIDKLECEVDYVWSHNNNYWKLTSHNYKEVIIRRGEYRMTK